MKNKKNPSELGSKLLAALKEKEQQLYDNILNKSHERERRTDKDSLRGS